MAFSSPPVAPFWSPSSPSRRSLPLGVRAPPRPISPLDYYTGDYVGLYGDYPKQEVDKSIGRRTEYKRVIERYDSLSMRWTTEEEKDDRVVSPKEIDKLSENCFNFRKKITPNGPDVPPTIMTYLDIKSWYLREVGKKVIGTQAGISWEATVLQIDTHEILPYYAELLSELAKCQKASEKSEDDELYVAHLALMLDFLRDEFKDVITEIEDLSRSREITWERVWALWKPGRLYFMNSTETDDPFVVRLLNAIQIGNGAEYEIGYEYIDYHKTSFGWKEGLTTVSKFIGRVATNTLDLYPFEHHSDHKKLRERLIARGRRWKELAGIHHQFYDGLAFMKDSRQRSRKMRVKGRVMIDKESYQNTMSNYRLNPFFDSLGAPPGSIMADKVTSQVRTPTDEDLLHAPPYVYGFSFIDKCWLIFQVDSLKEVTWDPTAFQNLSLNSRRKALLQSLVESHGGSNAFEDIVAGKGKGLIINLFGPPGTGKTLTAEATSEYARKPLYVVTAGELGNDSFTVGNKLSHIFDVCTQWDAIVLLDEADIFLERRSTHEIMRNAMVSVFLHELEYFEGILFMTTNRIETFDPAFQSRIHISLRYDALAFRSRREIWLAILRRAGVNEDSLSQRELDTLAMGSKNGREIRNIVRTAEAIAASRKEQLDYGHLSRVKAITDTFDKREPSRVPSLMTLVKASVVAVTIGSVLVRKYRQLM